MNCYWYVYHWKRAVWGNGGTTTFPCICVWGVVTYSYSFCNLYATAAVVHSATRTLPNVSKSLLVFYYYSYRSCCCFPCHPLLFSLLLIQSSSEKSSSDVLTRAMRGERGGEERADEDESLSEALGGERRSPRPLPEVTAPTPPPPPPPAVAAREVPILFGAPRAKRSAWSSAPGGTTTLLPLLLLLLMHLVAPLRSVFRLRRVSAGETSRDVAPLSCASIARAHNVLSKLSVLSMLRPCSSRPASAVSRGDNVLEPRRLEPPLKGTQITSGGCDNDLPRYGELEPRSNAVTKLDVPTVRSGVRFAEDAAAAAAAATTMEPAPPPNGPAGDATATPSLPATRRRNGTAAARPRP